MEWPRLNRFEGFSSFSEIQIRYPIRETTLSCTGDRVACASRGAAGGGGAQRSTINDNVRLKYFLPYATTALYILYTFEFARRTAHTALGLHCVKPYAWKVRRTEIVHVGSQLSGGRLNSQLPIQRATSQGR